ncbi:TatD family hydrolase [Elizabethkingia meningoseptica]|uniref:TatD family hydrolase n=1 Tax=Elizabethkingia meningoseptica TaxID=238 RepID=UPI0023B1FB6F|nr:TatD family hydrolase [Elizabethkingia meningoseptica]MDE5436879.1 TatD family hydrolase [Elizabethkingia meningoseptica]MDE5509094.1 TatD family hydrolase [Elizabethkingia meningoseptica]MDE5514611.1 TatD family hydrolase [Elizabethkingia meningoseptica]MDE5525297.1 TatD family hydrolase [Elizabethkingia meningoseptica]MDE5528878.1 TatD family hydrolase [Elizabethkingia meningoseptica]
MIDTHTHLYSEQFDEDRDEAISRAKEAGVERFYLPAIDSETHEQMLQLEAQYPGEIFAMMGLHPCSVQPETWEKELALVKEYIDKRPFCAIGEIGIDLYWDKSTLDIQVKAFEQQIDWAIEKDLPIVIHTRESFNETFEVLERKKHPKLRGIFHCFSGNLEQAQHAIDLGFILGIGGVVTFKNGKIDQFLDEIPLDKIVLETDSPYLAPVPHRGKRNESAYTSLVLGKLVDIYKKEYKEIEAITNKNALNMFRE